MYGGALYGVFKLSITYPTIHLHNILFTPANTYNTAAKPRSTKLKTRARRPAAGPSFYHGVNTEHYLILVLTSTQARNQVVGTKCTLRSSYYSVHASPSSSSFPSITFGDHSQAFGPERGKRKESKATRRNQSFVAIVCRNRYRHRHRHHCRIPRIFPASRPYIVSPENSPFAPPGATRASLLSLLPIPRLPCPSRSPKNPREQAVRSPCSESVAPHPVPIHSIRSQHVRSPFWGTA